MCDQRCVLSDRVERLLADAQLEHVCWRHHSWAQVRRDRYDVLLLLCEALLPVLVPVVLTIALADEASDLQRPLSELARLV